MKNEKEITLHSSLKKYTNYKYKFNNVYYKFTNFITNGDLATYNIIESKTFKNKTISKPVILTYSSNTTKDNDWMCKSIYELDKTNVMEINFGGITNDVLWMLSNNTIFIFDL